VAGRELHPEVVFTSNPTGLGDGRTAPAKHSWGWHETVASDPAQAKRLVEHSSDQQRSLRLTATFATPPDLTVNGPVVARITLLVDGARQQEPDVTIPPQGICLLIPAGRVTVDVINATGQTADVNAIASENIPASQTLSQQVAVAFGDIATPSIPAFARAVFVKPQSADVQVTYANGAKGVRVLATASDGYRVGLGDGFSGFELANMGVVDSDVRLDWEVFR